MAKRLATYRVDGDLLDSVAAKAATKGETVTAVIERAFREYVSREPVRLIGLEPKTTLAPRGRRAKSSELPPAMPSPGPPPRPRKTSATPEACDHRLRVGAFCKRCGRTKT